MTTERDELGHAMTTPLPSDGATVDERGGRVARGPERDDGSDAAATVIGASDGLEDAPAPLPTIGRFTVERELGAGGMGRVLLAHDATLDRQVAIKLLRHDSAGDASSAGRVRLLREAQAMARLRHPNVVTVYEAGVHEGRVYLVMEYVAGGTLRAWLDARGAGRRAGRPRTVTADEILARFAAAGRGLHAAHRAGVIHRDFKPENALVDEDGVVKVTDFGLARGDGEPPRPRGSRPELDALSHELTRTGDVMGTPRYMAPEQHTAEPTDARTDQFSFCVALYEALYGERPFTGKSYDELADHVVHGRVRPARAGSRVSPALRAIVLRGLAVKPGDRYPTMDHLLDDLAHDRAKPWRRAAIGAGALAVILGFGFAADWAVRDRLDARTRQAFAATGKQTEQTIKLIVTLNEAQSSQAYVFGAMQEVSAYREDADFGLGDASADRQELELLHGKLAAATWDFARTSTIGGRPNVIAVGDYKGRLLYTSAQPDLLPLTDLAQLPWVGRAIETGAANSMRLVANDDPQLAGTQLLGPSPPPGMSIVFTRTGLGGSSLFIQLVDADSVLAYMRMGTLLSIVAPGGHTRGDVPAELLARAPLTDGTIHEVTIDTATYQVRANPITGPDGAPVGHVVMASRVDGVLSLFPHARTVFAAAMLAAIAVAVAMAARARSLRA